MLLNEHEVMGSTPAQLQIDSRKVSKNFIDQGQVTLLLSFYSERISSGTMAVDKRLRVSGINTFVQRKKSCCFLFPVGVFNLLRSVAVA